MVNLAINGFGRIGRLAFRAALNFPQEIKVVAINTSGKMPIAGWVHLLKYDTAYGPFNKPITLTENGFVIDNQNYPCLAEPEPAKLPWKDLSVDIVIESTGVFRDTVTASQHLQAGAKKIIISAPAKDENIPTYLIGVNLENYQKETIIDAGSCTTNCAAPILKVILENFGVQKAFLTTVHAYTSDQSLQDGSHQDLRRARAATQNIIPTSTGASESVIKALPELKGKLEGLAIRVPVIVGSLLDLNVLLNQKTTVEAINQAFIQAAQGKLNKILAVTNEPLVSSDIIGYPASAIIDLSSTKIIEDDFVKVIAWYDNEWAYSQRLIETAIKICST